MKKELKIKNIFGEKLDTLIEGNENSENVIVFVHGLGTGKNEGDLYLELADFFKKDYLTVRFDQSSFGKSEGRQEDANIQKSANDLQSILFYVKNSFPDKRINILAHSDGVYAVCILSPCNVSKTVFTGISSMDLSRQSKGLEDMILSRGGKVNKSGITFYKRSTGEVQKIGRGYWQVLQNNLKKHLEEFSKKTDLIVFRSLQDQFSTEDGDFEDYKNIPTLQYEEIQGNHNIADFKDRKVLFKKIKRFLEE